MNPIVAARKVLGIPNPEQEFVPLTRQDLAQGVRDLPRSVKETAKFIPQGLNKALSIVSPIETAVAGLIGEEGTPEERIASAFVNDTDLVTALQNRNVPGAMPIGLAAGLAIPGAGEAKSVGKFVDDLPEFRKMVQNYDQLPKKMQVQTQEAGRRILEALPIGNTRDLINKIGQTSPRQWLEEVSEQTAGYMEETAQKTSRQVDQMQKITPGAGKAVEGVDPLVEQARKYKSADDFIDSLELTKQSSSNDKVASLARNVGVENFGGKGVIQLPSVKTNSDAVKMWETKILSGERPVVYAGSRGGFPKLIDGNNRLQAYKNLGFKEVPTVQPSQLTDIWKQANK